MARAAKLAAAPALPPNAEESLPDGATFSGFRLYAADDGRRRIQFKMEKLIEGRLFMLAEVRPSDSGGTS
jgi:hypothetical protein